MPPRLQLPFLEDPRPGDGDGPTRSPECASCDSGLDASEGDGRSNGPELRREDAGDSACNVAMSNIRQSSPPERTGFPPVYGGVAADPADSRRSRQRG